jgi:predicted HicB family RNase H-like nuclease
MKNVLEHKGYTGSVEFSDEDEVFFGKIVGIRDLVTFEADSVVKLKKAFKDAVEDYIATCKELGKDPDKEYKGSFNVRLKPKIHRLAAIKSATLKMSLNQFVEKVIEKEIVGNS